MRRRGGFILWLTGLSGAGKTTLARALSVRLEGQRPVELLDGDEMRNTLCRGLGFSREDRDANVFRIGYVARLLARHGVCAIVSVISPYREARNEVRRLAAIDGIPFVEIYLDAPLETLIGRDVKGLYKKALAGELAHFTGVSDPYEAPLTPELVVNTSDEPVDVSARRVLAAIAASGLTAAPAAQDDDVVAAMMR